MTNLNTCIRCGRNLPFVDQIYPATNEVSANTADNGQLWCGQCLDNPQFLVIDGELIDVDDTRDTGWSDLALAESGQREWCVAPDSETAGAAAREYWASMAANDPEEFTRLVGKSTLVSWCLGQLAGPGSTKVTSLDDWLDLWLNTPEEQWAGHDGVECDVEFASPDLVTDLGFEPTVAYRHN